MKLSAYLIAISKCGEKSYPLDLVLVEIWDLVHDHERQTATEINHLVHNEGHDSGGQDVVLHVGIPGGPRLLEDI